MTNKITKLPLDRNNRHFVVGDIHGRFQSFLNLLKEAKYDPANDIIYSVGDLIDRGPKSYEVVNFFTTMPNTYAVMGNHEFMACNPTRWQHVWLSNGGDKCLESISKNKEEDSYEWLVEILENLPWIIEVGDSEEEGSFRVVHADVPPEWSDEHVHTVVKYAVNEDGEFDGNDPSIKRLIWSRRTITQAMTNLSCFKPLKTDLEFHSDRKRHNFVGHTPIRKVTTVGDITFIDTWGSGTLSMVDALTLETYTVPVID